MKITAALAAFVVLAGCQTGGDVKLDTFEDKVSYSIGLNVGTSLMNDSISINPDAFLRGVVDARADSAGRLMSTEDVSTTIAEFQKQMQEKAEMRTQQSLKDNHEAGEAFLTENKTMPGVKVTESGLQYKVLTEGKGARPSASSTVEVHYTGRLLDGTVFDSSVKRGQPAVFRLDGVIAGWTEALELMPVGSKWELYIPPSLAYGENGAGNVIPPNSTLIFEVELLSIK